MSSSEQLAACSYPRLAAEVWGVPVDFDDRSLMSVLTCDHHRITSLLARLVRRGGHRRPLADELASELTRHIVAEELYLYPVVREVLPESAVDIAEHLEFDAQVGQILADLAGAEPDSNRFDVLITKLIVAGHQAILHEEGEVFPWLAQLDDRQTLTRLGDMIRAFENAAVVETTCGAGLAIRFGDLVLHRWIPATPAD